MEVAYVPGDGVIFTLTSEEQKNARMSSTNHCIILWLTSTQKQARARSSRQARNARVMLEFRDRLKSKLRESHNRTVRLDGRDSVVPELEGEVV